MLYFKAFHIISLVAWFAGLFYLPRLFVYHATTTDSISLVRFKLMESRLYYGITWPAALLTTVFGVILIRFNPEFYLHVGWMQIKLILVALLWVYHLACGYFLKQFARDNNMRSAFFFRVYNEVPTVFLITIVLLAVVKP